MRKTRKERLNDERNSGKKRGRNRMVFRGIVLCVFIFFFVQGFVFGNWGDVLKGDKALPPAQVTWEVRLINRQNHVPEEFRVDLGEVQGYKVDVRMAESLTQMIDAAAAEDIKLTICSAYRSIKKQRSLYEKQIQLNRDKGMGEEESIAETERYVNPPGASEHHIGLAIDFATPEAEDLTEAFADTDAYQWLKENGATYGFVERYPKKKEDITGTYWEPWHYRYVGKENAEIMTKKKLTLEEYLEKIEGKKEDMPKEEQIRE